jgi:hypothetical protein
MRKLTLALLTAAAFATPAHAGDGNKLLDYCAKRSPDYYWCTGYVLGVVDGMTYMGDLKCVPDVTAGQMADVVEEWLRRNPAQRHLSGTRVIELAALAAWPCR